MPWVEIGARCVVRHGWAQGCRGVVLKSTQHWDGTGRTVQLDNGARFLAKPGDLAPPSETPFLRAVRAEKAARPREAR